MASAVMKRCCEEGKSQMTEGDVSEGKRWRGHYGSVVVAVCCNKSGSFMKIESQPAASNGREFIFCLLAGKGGGGWNVEAGTLARIVGVGIISKPPPVPLEGVWAPRSIKKSYLEAATGVEEVAGGGGRPDERKKRVKIALF